MRSVKVLQGRADPVLLKGRLARVRPVYTWARRLRAYSRFRMGRPHDPAFAAFAQLGSREGLFLDVGASIGQSALSFRIFNPTAPVFSLEPLAVHQGDLAFAARVAGPMRYRIAGAAERPGRAQIHIPTVGGLELTAEASLSRQSAEEVIERLSASPSHRRAGLQIRVADVELVRVDDLGLQPASMKIDVEGGELSVIRGARATVKEHRPALMVERSPGTDEVAASLQEFGYEPFAFDAETHAFEPLRVGMEPLNVFFLTPEHRARVTIISGSAAKAARP